MRLQAQRILISSARKFINVGALSRLWNLVKNFHPADIASLTEHLTLREKLVLFNVILEKNKEKTAEVMSELDPALGSVNLLTMFTDTVGLLSFPGLGTIFLKYLA